MFRLFLPTIIDEQTNVLVENMYQKLNKKLDNLANNSKKTLAVNKGQGKDRQHHIQKHRIH